MEFNKDFIDGCSTFWTDENSESNRDESRNGDGNPVGDQPGLSWGGRMIHELTHDDIRRLEFGSEGEAYSFYSDYAKQRGFAVRKDDIERNENGDIVKRYLVCNKEGTRDKKHLERKDRVREARPITRVQCTARMHVYLDMRSGKWKVSTFHDDYNHELTPPTWVQKMYDMKRLWANSYMGDTFYGGIRTTSVCEGINSFIKRYVQNRNSLVDFLHNFDRALKEYRHNELISDFKSFYEEHVFTTTLFTIEECSSKVFTRKKFWEVKSEIESATAYNVVDRVVTGEAVRLTMNKFCKPDYEYDVVLDKSELKFNFECRMFESCGILCRHIFCAMKNELVKSIPSSLILKRWTKSAKPDFMSSEPVVRLDKEKVDMLREGGIGAACDYLSRVAKKHVHDYKSIMDDIYKLDEKIESRNCQSEKKNNGRGQIGDPEVVNTKGAPRKSRRMTEGRRCSNCKRRGHTKNKCPGLSQWDVLGEAEDDESSWESDGAMGNDKGEFSWGDDLTLSQRGSASISKGKRRCVSQPSQTSFGRAELQGLHDKVGERQAKQSRRSNGKQKNQGVDGAREEMKFGPGKMGPGAGVNNLPTSLFPHFPSTSMYPPPPCPRPPPYALFYGYGSYGYYGYPQ
ncbi:Zinc finger, CCHC-type [Sesbania bispinosa]|nr:Zinc finger, CCHC-type [Sesbania bispinosa]